MSNQAAWIPEARGKLVVKEAPMPQAGEGEVVVKNHAWAINPVEWKIQTYGIMLQSYPNILGVDSAGEVHDVGPGVTHLKKGDRPPPPPAHLAPIPRRLPALLPLHLPPRPKDPPTLPFKDAAVLPLAISTAANSLYNEKTLRLPYPSLTPSSTPSNQSVLIWGGSGSVGALAVQLARASGVKVVAVCGAQNIQNVRRLGAHEVIDYNSPSATSDILAALKGTEYLGVADCISTEASARGWTPVFEQLGGRTPPPAPPAVYPPRPSLGNRTPVPEEQILEDLLPPPAAGTLYTNPQ
ncbi:hypothetical protein GRF29_28g1669548 [Pseudopithomyces chartarum]|uniref:Enoyl reductase (ER) domain-containing protein n=1 Tax=Pseudopithomyces chartarum TaxID=1892770 RepID=A0AAN6RJG3_9PLEO|nr:hypothetical protein GRF29_28g1669548 [Pseudopithomyces chartarum]